MPGALNMDQVDRVLGVLIASAAGDALGAPFEFGPPLGPEVEVAMAGGGGWEPGEWTDDTAMAVVIAQAAADGHDLLDPVTQDGIVRRWKGWAKTAKDVGIQTREVLSAATDAASCRAAGRQVHERTGRSGGNGSLMRTHPVALAYLHDEQKLRQAATELSTLTHHDPRAAEACVLWCLAVRHAVLTGELDLRRGLAAIGDDGYWTERIDDAEHKSPRDFPNNGWVVEALQGAWSAIVHADGDLRRSIDNAVRGGNDTDTVAAIAGALVGAVHGVSEVPSEWTAALHGWPGLTGADLGRLAERIVIR